MGDADQRSTNLPPANGGETPAPEPSSAPPSGLESVTPEESLTELETPSLRESAHLSKSEANPLGVFDNLPELEDNLSIQKNDLTEGCVKSTELTNDLPVPEINPPEALASSVELENHSPAVETNPVEIGSNPPELDDPSVVPSAPSLGSSSELPTEEASPGTTPQLPDPPVPVQRAWRNAPRPQKWTQLQRPATWPLWLLGLGTLVLVYLFVLTSFYWVGQAGSQILFLTLRYFSWVQPPVGITVGLLWFCFTAAPWVLGWSVKRLGTGRALTLAELGERFPETARLLEKFSTDRRWPPMKLWYLEHPAPLGWSFGWLPRAHWSVLRGEKKFIPSSVPPGLAPTIWRTRRWR